MPACPFGPPTTVRPSRAPVRAAGGFLLPLLLLIGEGCAVIAADLAEPPSRGKLSDAAEQAKKPPEEQEPVADSVEEPSTTKSEEDDAADADSPADGGDDQPGAGEEIVVVPAQLESGRPIVTVEAVPESVVARPDRIRFFLGPVAGTGFEAGGIFERIDAFGLQGGGWKVNEWVWTGVEIVHAGLEVKPGHHLNDALHDVTELGLGVVARGYGTPPHTFVGAYLLAGYRFAILDWKWRNPVDGLEGDSINTHSFYLGFGVSPIQTKHLHVGANFSYGLRIFANATSEGFENDLFEPVGFGRLMFEFVLVQ